MYMVPLKTLLTEAMKITFDESYIEEDFRELHASIEMPVESQQYPGIWVDYVPRGQLQIMGVGHYETEDVGGLGRRFTRWHFGGHATYTMVALSSLERDRLYDEVVRVMAFGREASSTNTFRQYIEDNEFLAVNFDFDEIGSGGFATTPGTPWGSDDIIYEGSITMECFGEFVSDSEGATLVPLSAIEFYPYSDQEEDPTTGDEEGVWH